jgi:hypothetical protein
MYVLGAGMEPMATQFKDNRGSVDAANLQAAQLQLQRKKMQADLKQALGLQDLDRERIGADAYQRERDRQAQKEQVAANLGLKREMMQADVTENTASRQQKTQQFDAELGQRQAEAQARQDGEARKRDIEDRYNKGRLSNEERQLERV